MELICLVWLRPLGHVQKNSLQFSPGIAKTRKIKLFILSLYPSHFNWCHFPSNTSSPQAGEKERKRKIGIVGKEN